MSEFVVSARKYRPTNFDEVVGQAHIGQTLKNAMSTNKVAHAFLFCGPRGVGKTTCARILAKVLNCETPTKEWHACNTCSSCKSFDENASFNIIELDAASNNSVEHIRSLVDQVRFQPQQGQYKIFIIDEVHMLSTQAFNAFLKTLEEPPPYAKFILATTEKHKILATILSRCQIFDFRRIGVTDMVQHLKEICAKESIKAEEDALHIVAQKADGALRDALSIFDRVVGFSGADIRYDDVIENLNVLDYDYFFQIVDALLSEDLQTVLTLFDQILRKGFDPDLFIVGLAEHLRNLLVSKDAATFALLDTSETLMERYKKQASLAPTSFIVSTLDLCNECDINYKMARQKKLHVEMALIKMAYAQRAIQGSAFGGATEKKKIDLSEGRNPQPISTQKTASAPISTEPAPPSDAAPVAPTPKLVEEPSVSLKLTPPTEQPIEPKVKSNANSAPSPSTPKLPSDSQPNRLLQSRQSNAISLNLEDYMDQVITEEEDSGPKISRLTFDNVQKAWHGYIASVDSPSLRNILSGADLVLKEKNLQVTTTSTLAKSMIQQETRLFDRLREEVNDMDLKMVVHIDESKAEELRKEAEAKRPLTKKEKFEQMVEANPVVRELVARFELRLEE